VRFEPPSLFFINLQQVLGFSPRRISIWYITVPSFCDLASTFRGPSGQMTNINAPPPGLLLDDQAPKTWVRFWAPSEIQGSGFQNARNEGGLLLETPICRHDTDACHASFRWTTQIVRYYIRGSPHFAGSLDVT
jgi:hypothetical protein